jgi:hypothetical protein
MVSVRSLSEPTSGSHLSGAAICWEISALGSTSSILKYPQVPLFALDYFENSHCIAAVV